MAAVRKSSQIFLLSKMPLPPCDTAPSGVTVATKMGSNPPSNQDYWGYLIEPDKTPTPLFEQLLLGIAHYIVGLRHYPS